MFDRSGSRKYLNDLERRAFYETLLQEPDDSRRAFLLTLFHTGCRISEALRLPVGRIDVANGSIVFETLKRRKSGCFRSVPVPDALINLLKGLIVTRGDDGRIWGFCRKTGYRMVRTKMKEARVVGAMACPKGLRHSHGVACVAAKIPLTLIKKWFGHSRLETTSVYLDVLEAEERALARRLW